MPKAERKPSKIKVLYIDDDEPLLEIAKLTIDEAGGISMDTMSDPVQAIEGLRGKGYDVIVCDYQMPVKDGIEVLK